MTKYILLTCCVALAASQGMAQKQSAPNKTAANKAAVPSAAGISGKVVETINAASYTYVQVDTGKEKVWAAAPQFPVKVGDQVAAADSMPMKNYHSKTLKRDFDVVYFCSGFTVNGKSPQASAGAGMDQLPAGHPPIGGMAGHGQASAPDLNLKGIKKADKTVEEVYASKAKLKGQSTAVRGKVVKFNANIMGKNWVHIQDGSGAVGNNDLLVTTSSNVKVGDTVVVTGKVAVDKDFGANYKYAVMIEDAKIVVE